MKPTLWPRLSLIPSSDEITHEQRGALQIATREKVGILSGGPGRGKSFVIARLVKLLPPGDVALIAPTGRAAVRMCESMEEAGASCVSSTIHRLLTPTRNGYDRNGWAFRYGRSERLEFTFYVMDETSMVSSSLMSDFLAAMPENAHILFVGDPHQLPPVGAGKPFLDMIDAGINNGELKHVHRFAGRIARICKAIHEEDSWEPSAKIDLEAESPENFRHIQSLTSTDQIEKLKFALERVKEREFDLVKDVQILTPMNDKGPVCRKELNLHLQEFLNPATIYNSPVQNVPFRIGDKVICLKNGSRDVYVLTEEGPEQDGCTYVANGEIGFVRHVTGDKLFVDFDGLLVGFSRKVWKTEVSLAYAITVHKAQGSGFPVVINIIDEAARYVASKAYWYTAISRAKKLCITIGRLNTLRQQCRRVDVHRRKTFLRQDIREWHDAH